MLKDKPETLYQIHCWAPAENAIGGEAYWEAVKLPHGHHSIDDEFVANKWFQEATITPRRLVAVKSTVLKVATSFPCSS